ASFPEPNTRKMNEAADAMLRLAAAAAESPAVGDGGDNPIGELKAELYKKCTHWKDESGQDVFKVTDALCCVFGEANRDVLRKTVWNGFRDKVRKRAHTALTSSVVFVYLICCVGFVDCVEEQPCLARREAHPAPAQQRRTPRRRRHAAAHHCQHL